MNCPIADFAPDSPSVGSIHPSPNINERRGCSKPTILILHYTGLPTVADSIRILSDPVCQVSCHYVIDEAGAVTQMVPEGMRAWHAGVSFWQGQTDINSMSIGIEIQNPGHDAGYPDFPDQQMDRLIKLARDIVNRNTIAPQHVLAHSDIAPQRKNDPGEKFDWQRLWQAGLGHWVPPSPIEVAGGETPAALSGEAAGHVLAALRDYGYDCPSNDPADPVTRKVVTAFQRHFRPALVNGVIDRSTSLTLDALVAALKPAA